MTELDTETGPKNTNATASEPQPAASEDAQEKPALMGTPIAISKPGHPRSSAFWGATGGVIGGLIGAFAALIVAYFAYFQTEKLYRQAASQSEEISRNAAYVSFIQSRIEGCVALASHHREAAANDKAENYVEIAVLTLEDQSKVVMTGNYQRYLASIGMARSLLLCMAPGNVAQLQGCVEDINSYHSGIHVFDYIGADPTIYGRLPNDGEVFPGTRNIVC